MTPDQAERGSNYGDMIDRSSSGYQEATIQRRSMQFIEDGEPFTRTTTMARPTLLHQN